MWQSKTAGWVKSYRMSLSNEVYRQDHTAWRIFTSLLLIVDKDTGSWSGGIYQLSSIMVMNPNTIYKALKRLQKNNMISYVGKNKYSVIYICNWSEYQCDGKNKVKTGEKQSKNRVRLNKKKEVRSKNNSLVETQSVYDLFVQKFHKNPNTYKLTDKRKLKIRARLKDAGLEMLSKAITNTASSSFYTGDNDRGWHADLDFIIRSYEQVERLASMDKQDISNVKPSEVEGDMEYVI